MNHRSGFLARVMASCLKSPSHNLNQCWPIKGILWHSLENKFTRNAYELNLLHTVETLYSTIYYSKYFIELNFDKSTQYVALWTHKRHPIPRPFGRAMECLLWVFHWNWPCYKGFLHMYVDYAFKIAATSHMGQWVNSSPPSTAFMHQWIRSALVQIMACCLYAAKPLSKPMLGYCQLGP